MKNYCYIALMLMGFLVIQCQRDQVYEPINPEIAIKFPVNFPERNPALRNFKMTQYGVELGEKLFNDNRLSVDNTVSCATCHKESDAYADQSFSITPGVHGLVGFRNAPSLQNMFWVKNYMWDGAVTDLEKQPIIPITLEVEMGNTIANAISKIEKVPEYQILYTRVYGEEKMTAKNLLNAITQYVLTLVSSDSKYDKITRNEGETYTASEQQGYNTFQQKCVSCHSGPLFSDESFRNIGFPINQNPDINGEFDLGRKRVSGLATDRYSFRVPSLRNVEYTAPYGSSGQFATLKQLLDYFDNGVINSYNLDPILKNNGNKIPLSETEKTNLIAFMKTLSDKNFVGKP